MQKKIRQKSILYFSIILSLLFLSFSLIDSKNEVDLNKTRFLNKFIQYLNTETQKTILFPAYLYLYNEEVKRYKMHKNPTLGGPYYFSPHKYFIPSEPEFKKTLKLTNEFPVYKKLLQAKLKRINYSINLKFQLIQELHKYSTNKIYEKDNFVKYNEIYRKLTQSINSYFYECVNLYLSLQHINLEIKTKPTKAKEKEKTNNILFFIKKLNADFHINFQLIKNTLAKYSNGLVPQKISFQNIQLKDTNYIQYHLMAGISQGELILAYKNYIISSTNFRKNYERFSKDSLFINRIKKITRITLFYNDVIEKINNFTPLIENTFSLEIQNNFLLKLKMPILYLPDYKKSINKQIFDEVPPARIVLLLDFSSSMQQNKKLDLLKSTIPDLFSALRPQDRIALVVFSGTTRIILPLSDKSYYRSIPALLDKVEIGNTLKISNGLDIAYHVLKNEDKDMNRRIIIATDGVFKTDNKLLKQVHKNAISGMKLSVFYFGNSKSDINPNLKQLSIKGLGSHYKINNQNIKFHFLRELNGM